MLREYQVTGSRAKLSLELREPKESIPAVWADKDRVKQVLINFIGNGLKFTKQGGVFVDLVVEENGCVKVSVTDTGIGIAEENQQLLFRKFQQAESNIHTRDTTKGTGLGLYISKLITEGMGGNIALEKSEVGKGSIFSFTLPVAKATT